MSNLGKTIDINIGSEKELGDFLLLQKIGSGGMGVVYKARQKSLNRIVAVKVLYPKLAENPENVSRFMREARSAAALNHPGIVHCISVGQDSGYHYLVMEFLAGKTVAARFKHHGPLPLLDVLELGRQSARALGHAHAKGLLHRDIKPANLIILAEASVLTVKLLDFGLARMIDDASMTMAGIALGTPLYISPEQARGVRELTPACDLYALGAMLLHLVSGKAPYRGETTADIMSKHVLEPVPEPKDFKSDLPDGFCGIIRKLMRKDPKERYTSAEELADAFDRELTILKSQEIQEVEDGNGEKDDMPVESSALPATESKPKRGWRRKPLKVAMPAKPASAPAIKPAISRAPRVRRKFIRSSSNAKTYAALAAIALLSLNLFLWKTFTDTRESMIADAVRARARENAENEKAIERERASNAAAESAVAPQSNSEKQKSPPSPSPVEADAVPIRNAAAEGTAPVVQLIPLDNNSTADAVAAPDTIEAPVVEGPKLKAQHLAAEALKREENAEKAWQDAEALFSSRKFREARNAYKAFQIVFDGTHCAERHQTDLDSRLQQLEHDMPSPQPVRPTVTRSGVSIAHDPRRFHR